MLQSSMISYRSLLFIATTMIDYYTFADSFLDMWIYVVIKAGLKDLVSYVIIAHPTNVKVFI